MSICMTCKYNEECGHDDFCLNYDSNGKEIAAIVRCKDCKYSDYWDGYLYCKWHGWITTVKDTWYCADGERKEQSDA